MPLRVLPSILTVLLALAAGMVPQHVSAAPSPSPSASSSPAPALPIRRVTADTQPNPTGATHVERPPLGGARRR